MKLAEALLRRKELNTMLDRMKFLNNQDLFIMKSSRVKAHEGFDDLNLAIPKISWAEFQRAFNWYSKQLRLVDAAIQNANWITEIYVEGDVMKDYEPDSPLS